LNGIKAISIIMLISSPQYGPLILSPVSAANIPGVMLPGSTTFMCKHEFGNIIMQEVKTSTYSLRYLILDLIKKVTLVLEDEQSALKAKLSLKNNLSVKIGNKKKHLLKVGHCVVFSGNENEETFFLEKNREYRLFNAAYSHHTLKDLIDAFPSIKDFTDNYNDSSKNLHSANLEFSSETILQIVNDLFKCPYDEKLRKIYFGNRVNDFLFELLAASDQKQPNISIESTIENKAISKARNLILQDLTQHMTIKEISQYVQLNEFKLKTGFKEAFGVGMFEYLIQARMKEAHRLIVETDKPLKEIAMLVGYEYFTNFIAAFRDHFSYTPASLRRRK